MGEFSGQLEDERYMIQASIKFGFDPGIGFTTGGKRSESAKSKASSASGGKGSSSRRGSRRGIKVRR